MACATQQPHAPDASIPLYRADYLASIHGCLSLDAGDAERSASKLKGKVKE
jgi:hypothetical protein